MDSHRQKSRTAVVAGQGGHGSEQTLAVGPLVAGGAASIDSYGKFGVYTYGKTEVLLHYYARMIDVKTHDDLHELARAEQMKLDIVPHDHGDELELTVFWQGKPAANRPVFVRGPQNLRKNLNTDANGELHLKIENPGQYMFRTNVEEDKQGTDGDRRYDLIRHNGTLVITLPLTK